MESLKTYALVGVVIAAILGANVGLFLFMQSQPSICDLMGYPVCK